MITSRFKPFVDCMPTEVKDCVSRFSLLIRLMCFRLEFVVLF